MAANTREFSITGTWADPKVERLQRANLPTNEQVDRAVNPPEAAPLPAPATAPTPIAPAQSSTTAPPSAPTPRRTP